MPYHSGTTSNPEGVLLNHQNLVANMAQIRPLLAMNVGEMIVKL
ncbi:hypothetical protein OG607_03540 [Streptomyces sp. NBC_01537]